MIAQHTNYFSMPNEIFSLGLSSGEFAVYAYLLRCENWRTHQCWPSYATIGAAVGMTKKTVQKHVRALVDKGLIQAEDTTIRRKNGKVYNGSLLYTLTPIKQVCGNGREHFWQDWNWLKPGKDGHRGLQPHALRLSPQPKNLPRCNQ